jgi:hypothetical protein
MILPTGQVFNCAALNTVFSWIIGLSDWMMKTAVSLIPQVSRSVYQVGTTGILPFPF